MILIFNLVPRNVHFLKSSKEVDLQSAGPNSLMVRRFLLNGVQE
jgi:hypothetical protein